MISVYEYGESCPYEGWLWSMLTTDDVNAFGRIKASLIAKIESDIVKSINAIDEEDDDKHYQELLIIQKRKYLERLEQLKSAQTYGHLVAVSKIRIIKRQVAKSKDEHYWSAQADTVVKAAKMRER